MKLNTSLQRIVVVLVSIALVGVAGASSITALEEDFESMSDGPLDGQNGWTAFPSTLQMVVDSTNRLGTRTLDGLDTPSPRPPHEFASATKPFQTTGSLAALVVRFDAYAVQDTGTPSHDSGLHLVSSSHPAPAHFDYYGISWWYNTSERSWKFDARFGTVAPANIDTVSGGFDKAVAFEIVVDRTLRETWGVWDFGGGEVGETTHFSLSLEQIDALDHIQILQDYRFTASTGVEIDNITVSYTQTIPLPTIDVRLAGDQLILSWPSVSGFGYQPQMADPGLTGWTDIPDSYLMGTGAILSYHHDLGATPPDEQFFRVKIDLDPSDPPTPADMVLIPAGSFQMGRQSGEGTRFELPVHGVEISAFYLDKFEVSKEHWDVVKEWGHDNGYEVPVGVAASGDAHPVGLVEWFAAVRWCNARSEMEGLTPVYYTDATRTTVYQIGRITLQEDFVDWSANGYRLPTEAEWEKAARGGLNGNTYPWGNSITGADANYTSSGDPFEPGSSPIGYFDGGQTPAGLDRANGYGLYDMAGNVSEWCWDTRDRDWYSNPEATAKDTRGPEFLPSSHRAYRGGSWGRDPSGLRCAIRYAAFPNTKSTATGFRCARGL